MDETPGAGQGAGHRHEIGAGLIVALHAQVVAAYSWTPGVAWQLTLSEALRFLAAKKRCDIRRMLLASRILMMPLAKKQDQANLIGALRQEMGERPMTLDEEFGSKVAAEVAELERRNAKWLKVKREKAQQKKQRRKRAR